MKRVAVINLAGRAWSVEEAGVDALDAWMDDARARLAGDPDRDELLADFERAIADKCAALAQEDRDVVSEAQVAEILASLGTVEPVDATDDSWRTRRLYRISGDEAILGGVCAGIAAWARVDVTVVRALTVLLVVLSSGALLIAYLLLWWQLPEANTPDERAAAHGFGATAQDLVERARSNAGPALSDLGDALRRVTRGLARAVTVLLTFATALVLASWAGAVAWALADGSELLSVFDAGTSTWVLSLLISSAALIVVLPLVALTVLARRAAGRPWGPRVGLITAIGFATWLVAIATLTLVVFTQSHQLRDLAHDGNARLHFGATTVCIVDDPDDVDAHERCQPGDERWINRRTTEDDWDHWRRD